MSEKVNDYDANPQLSQLVGRGEAGEERVVPFRAEGVKRTPGRMRGRIRVANDFDAPMIPSIES
jgi:hypothetical protein